MYIDALAARPQFSLMTSPALNGAAESKPGETDGERERGALRDLEQFFLFTLLKEMRKTINNGGLFEQNPSREYYDELLDHALSKEMARSGQLGLAGMLEQQLQIADLQRSAHNATSSHSERSEESQPIMKPNARAQILRSAQNDWTAAQVEPRVGR